MGVGVGVVGVEELVCWGGVGVGGAWLPRQQCDRIAAQQCSRQPPASGGAARTMGRRLEEGRGATGSVPGTLCIHPSTPVHRAARQAAGPTCLRSNFDSSATRAFSARPASTALRTISAFSTGSVPCTSVDHPCWHGLRDAAGTCRPCQSNAARLAARQGRPAAPGGREAGAQLLPPVIF